MFIFLSAYFESCESIAVALWKHFNWFGRVFVYVWFVPLVFIFFFFVFLYTSIKYRKEEAEIK